MHEQLLSKPERQAITRALWEYYSIHLVGQDELAEKTFRLAERMGKATARMELTRSEAHIVLEALRLFSREKARTKNRGDHPLLAAEMHKKMAKQVEELEYAQKIKDPYRKKE